MACIDLNPVRARMVANRAGYPWSAHRHIVAKSSTALVPHPLYLDLGVDRLR